MSQTDPRVFFAAERTLLAWLRSGLALMGLGFVVSRFGLFVRVLAAQTHASPTSVPPSLSAALGIAFVVAGALAMILSALQHQRFIAALPPPALPPRYSRVFAIALSLFVGALGLVLAAYLLATEA